MEKTYISITITYYNSKCNIAPSVMYYCSDEKLPKPRLQLEDANRLTWELVKMGGTNTYRSNIYDNAISERIVTFWGFL